MTSKNDNLNREAILAATTEAYERLRNDPEAWAAYQAELEEWDAMPSPGLEDEEANQTPDTSMTDIDQRIAEIEARYTPVEVPPCRVCGAPLQLGQIAMGSAEWNCSSITLDTWIPLGQTGWSEQRDHHAESVYVERLKGPDVLWLISQLREHRSLCDRYREALEWYACEDTYMVQHNVRREEPEFVIAAHDDRGARARVALQGDSND